MSVGIGSQYPVVGAQVAYYFQLPRSLFRVAPYAAMGGFVCAHPDLDCHLGAALGGLGSWGHKHRLVLGLAFATVGAIAFGPHGEPIDSRPVWGINLGVGYEYMTLGGFFFRFDLGVALALSPLLLSAPERLFPGLTLVGVGYKLW